MVQDDKIDVILEALGEQAPVVIIAAGVAWQCHLVKFSAYVVTAVARMVGSPDVRGERTFHLDAIDDIAIFTEPEAAAEPEDNDLNKLARDALARQYKLPISDPAVERAMRAAHAKLKGQEDGSQHHGPASDGRQRRDCGACNGVGTVGRWRDGTDVTCRACHGDGLARR